MKLGDKTEITGENVDALVDQYADTWLPAKEIEGMFRGIYRQCFEDWFKASKIRREQVIPIPQRGARYRYSVADVIIARHNTRKLKPFKRRRRPDGVMEACCNICDQWKPCDPTRDDCAFYRNPSKKDSGRMHTHCKKCHTDLQRSLYHRSEKARQRDLARSMANRILRQEAAQATKEWQARQSQIEIDAAPVADFIERNHSDVSKRALSELCSLHGDTIRKVISQARKGNRIRLSTADAILTNLGGEVLLSQILDELEIDRPQWSRYHPYCQRCLRTSVAHAAGGLCHTCYIRRDNPDYVPIMEDQWARRHVCCVGCGTTERKHYGKGMCNRCYQKESRQRKKLLASVGSGHGNPRSSQAT